MSRYSALIKPIIVSTVVGIALYIVVMGFSGYRETAQAASLLSAADWSLVLALALLHFLLRFMRWQWYLAQLGHRVPWGRSLVFYMSGFALTATPGKLGENIRSIYLKPEGVPYTHSLAAFFAERFTDLLAVATLSILALARFQSHIWPVVAAAALILLVFLMVRAPQFPRLLDTLQGRLQGPRLRTGLAELASTLRASSTLLGFGTLLISYTLGLLAWGIQALILFLILEAMGLPADMAIAVGIFCLGLLVGALSFLPGGLGSTEAVMILLLVHTGISTPDATAATLLCRIATLWFAVALGALALFGAQFSVRGKRVDV